MSEYYDFNNPYRDNESFWVPFNPCNLRLETNGSLFLGDLKTDENTDNYFGNQFRIGLSGALENVHLVGDFFTVGIKGNFLMDTTGPTHLGGDGSVPFFFYTSDPRNEENRYVTRFGVEPLAFRGNDSKLLSVGDAMEKDDELSFGSYSPAVSFLFFDKKSKVGLFFNTTVDAHGEGSVSNDDDTIGKFTTNALTFQAELFWMPFWKSTSVIFDGWVGSSEVGGPTFVRGITFFISGEDTARWFDWDKSENGGVEFDDYKNFGQIMFGLRYNLFGNDGNGILSRM